MGRSPYGRSQQEQPVQPPNVFFDGTRLGLEGSMVGTLTVAGLGGMHVGLSAVLGYLVRLSAGLPEEPQRFAFFSFLFISVLASTAIAMFLFFSSSIPTMAYAMVLVAGMLRWVGKRLPKVKLWGTVFGSVLGLGVGVGISAVVMLLFDLDFNLALYSHLLSWPKILTIDAIALVWLTVYPILSAAGGAQVGWRLGKQLDELSMYWFW